MALPTYMSSGRMRNSASGDSSLGRNKISKTTDVHGLFGSESERDSKEDDYELLGRMPSQSPLRPAHLELSNLNAENYPRDISREYRSKVVVVYGSKC
jgi:hypothetical protein